MSLVHYWYIDKKGIDSLLAQISSELIQEEHIKTIRKGIGKVAGNVGLAKILQQFFNADVTLSGGVETICETERVEMQPYETKIQKLMRYVEENEILLSNEEEILTKYEQGKSNFFFGTLELDTKLDVSDWEQAVKVIKEWGYIQFYKDKENTYDYSDNYYKTSYANNLHLVMSLGTEKMQIPYLGYTSHLSVFFRAFNGKNIPLGIFGHILNLNSKSFQIKPYAVWVV